MPAQDRVRGDQEPEPPAARFGYHCEQSREQSPVRPVQVRAARLMSLQDRELVAQDQDLGGLPCRIGGWLPLEKFLTLIIAPTH